MQNIPEQSCSLRMYAAIQNISIKSPRKKPKLEIQSPDYVSPWQHSLTKIKQRKSQPNCMKLNNSFLIKIKKSRAMNRRKLQKLNTCQSMGNEEEMREINGMGYNRSRQITAVYDLGEEEEYQELNELKGLAKYNKEIKQQYPNTSKLQYQKYLNRHLPIESPDFNIKIRNTSIPTSIPTSPNHNQSLNRRPRKQKTEQSTIHRPTILKNPQQENALFMKKKKSYNRAHIVDICSPNVPQCKNRHSQRISTEQVLPTISLQNKKGIAQQWELTIRKTKHRCAYRPRVTGVNIKNIH